MGFQLCALERVLGPALFSCRRLQSPHLQCGAHPGARRQPPPQAAPLPQPLTCSHLTFFIPSHPIPLPPHRLSLPLRATCSWGRGGRGGEGTLPACHHWAVPVHSSPCGFLFPIKCSRWVSVGCLPLPPAVVQPPCLRQKSF